MAGSRPRKYNSRYGNRSRRRRGKTLPHKRWYALCSVFLAIVVAIMAENGEILPDHQDTVTEGFADESIPEDLEVHYLDVGQGDATLVLQGEWAMLIDTGDDTKGTMLQNTLQKLGITKLDLLILTHPDSDHIGGAPVIITKFDVDQVLMSDYVKDNKMYNKLLQALDDKNMGWTYPEPGSTYAFGDAALKFVGPNEAYDEPNNASLAFVLTFGKNSFLFSGDTEGTGENDILDAGWDIEADVYKVGHHGSNTSSGQDFMETVNPAYAVISCSADNSYGHPHAEVLNRLREMGVLVFRTDEQGSIVATSNGDTVTWNCAPDESWKAGEG